MKNIFFILLLSNLACSIHSNHSRELSGLDAHMHISAWKGDDDMMFTGARALLAADSIGIKRAIVLSNSYQANTEQEEAVKRNDYVASQMKKYPGKLSGACAVNPLKSWYVAEMKRCKEVGLKILKIHSMASGMDLKIPADTQKLHGALKMAGDLGFTVLIHGNFPESFRGDEAKILLGILEKTPETKYIIGHLLGNEFRHLKNFKHPNFWVEISAAPLFMKTSEQKEALVEVMKAVGLKYFVFGSDWPVLHPAETLKGLRELPLSESEVSDIIYKNTDALNYLFES